MDKSKFGYINCVLLWYRNFCLDQIRVCEDYMIDKPTHQKRCIEYFTKEAELAGDAYDEFSEFLKTLK